MTRFAPLAALALLAACGKPPPGAGSTAKAAELALRPVKVQTAPVELAQMPRYLTLTGSVHADRQSEVAANVAGRITATYVERGQPVKQGQIIAAVDPKAAGYSAAAARAQSQAAEAQVKQAKEDCARADDLFAQGAIPRAEYDRMKTQCTAQIYQASAARANADLAGKLAGDTAIRAPFDGIVGERFVNVGEYVQPPSRVASIYAIDPARITISVPEPAVGQVHEGQTLQVRVSAWPDRDFPAVVRYVSPALRPSTRDLIIEATAENQAGLLRPGMFATARLLVGHEEEPTVPADAVQTDGTVRRIYLARGGEAFEVVVTTGVSKDGRVAVLEPLPSGERVIVRPPPGLRDGTAIQ